MISIVIPVYNCNGCIHELVDRIISSVINISSDFEIILVDDGSPDNAWALIQQTALENKAIKGIKLARNFGQHQAITAGLRISKGDWVVVMDCDLQDDPTEIEKLYSKALEGHKIVYAKRAKRNDTAFKVSTSKLFHKVLTYFTGQFSDPSISNFGIYSKDTIKYFNTLSERNRSFPMLIRWFGFNSVTLPVYHHSRHEGHSSYTLRRLFRLAAEIIISHSNKPLYLSIFLGAFTSIISFLYAIFLTLRYFIKGITVQGWTSLMVAICIIAGILMMNIGILGIYIGKIFDHVKNRPLFVVEETINTDADNLFC